MYSATLETISEKQNKQEMAIDAVKRSIENVSFANNAILRQLLLHLKVNNLLFDVNNETDEQAAVAGTPPVDEEESDIVVVKDAGS